MTYPPVLQALLDACDELRLAEYRGHVILAEGQDLMPLTKAINHWRAAKAEGFVPDASATLADAMPVVQEWAERAVLAERSNAVNSRLFGSAQRDLDAAEERIERAVKILSDGFKAPEEMRTLALEALRGEL